MKKDMTFSADFARCGYTKVSRQAMQMSRMQLPYGEDPDSLLHGSGFVSFRRQITASLHLALLETYEHHLLRQIAKTVSDLSLCLSCEDRISLLSLLAKQKSRLSRVTMRLGRNVVV